MWSNTLTSTLTETSILYTDGLTDKHIGKQLHRRIDRQIQYIAKKIPFLGV